jgi:SDR family mycofactocin-dependent oxidoreductase
VQSLSGKVALITGAARGQGRSHAVRLAEEGADVVAVDICAQIDRVPYPLATQADLDETVEQVKAVGGNIVAFVADVRDRSALDQVVKSAVAEVGELDIVIANAGIAAPNMVAQLQDWYDVIDVNLNGVYHTVEATKDSIVRKGRGGSIVLTSSTAGLLGIGGPRPGSIAYTAAKHGVVGLMRAYANHLAPHQIRVNSVHPTGVASPMVLNDAMQEFLQSDATFGQENQNALSVDMIEPVDISNAIAWLVSDSGRYVTGVTLPVDAGFIVKR